MNQSAALFYALLLGSSAPCVAQSEDLVSHGPKEAVAFVRAFLNTFDEALRESVQFPFDASERRSWRRDPSPRPGVALKDMTPAQTALVDHLLESVFSDAGIKSVKGIMNEQDLLAKGEEGLGSGYYWLAIYGEPGQGKWAWRLGGHHVSLHLTYDGSTILSATPLLLGGEADGDANADWAGYRALRPRENLARRLLAVGDGPSANPMRIGDVAPSGLALSERTTTPSPNREAGLTLARMTHAQQDELNALVDAYTSIFHPVIAESLRQGFQTIAQQARFAWQGSVEPGREHYYRVYGEGFLIEYWNSGAHMHTLLRSDGDFGDSK